MCGIEAWFGCCFDMQCRSTAGVLCSPLRLPWQSLRCCLPAVARAAIANHPLASVGTVLLVGEVYTTHPLLVCTGYLPTSASSVTTSDTRVLGGVLLCCVLV